MAVYCKAVEIFESVDSQFQAGWQIGIKMTHVYYTRYFRCGQNIHRHGQNRHVDCRESYAHNSKKRIERTKLSNYKIKMHIFPDFALTMSF